MRHARPLIVRCLCQIVIIDYASSCISVFSIKPPPQPIVASAIKICSVFVVVVVVVVVVAVVVVVVAVAVVVVVVLILAVCVMVVVLSNQSLVSRFTCLTS